MPAPDLVDAPRNQRIRLLSHVVFCFEQIVAHQFSEEKCREDGHILNVVIVWSLSYRKISISVIK